MRRLENDTPLDPRVAAAPAALERSGRRVGSARTTPRSRVRSSRSASWADPYTNPGVPVDGLDVPRKALVGPWGHVSAPGCPGRRVGFLEESRRWWDRWLKGREEREEREEEPGLADEPMIRAARLRPAAVREQAPGGWVAEEAWPSPRIRERKWHLNPDGLGSYRVRSGRPVASPATVGRTNPIWLKNGDGSPEGPRRPAGRRRLSLCFDSEPLAEPLAFLEAPGRFSRGGERPAGCAGERAPLGGAVGRGGRPRELRHPQPHPRRGPRTGDAARAGRAVRGPSAQRQRPPIRGGEPDPGRGRDRLWPIAWARPRARDPHRRHPGVRPSPCTDPPGPGGWLIFDLPEADMGVHPSAECARTRPAGRDPRRLLLLRRSPGHGRGAREPGASSSTVMSWTPDSAS